jgi:pantothenate kinase-related protein Tda10
MPSKCRWTTSTSDINEESLLSERNPGNELFKVRGQPRTHDADLALEFFEQFCTIGKSGKERL